MLCVHNIQFSSVAQSCLTLQPHGLQHTRPSCPSPTQGVYSNSCPLSQWYHPTTASSVHPPFLPPSIFPSISVFSNESVLCMRWPKYWSFSFSISPSNEYSGLISFRMDWLDLLAVQGTLKSLLQHHSSKASILQRSAFFIIQLSHPYTTTGKTIALARWTFITLSTFVRQQVSKPYVVAFFFLKNFSLLISLVHNLSSSSKENNCYIFVLFGLSGRTPNWHFLMKAIVIANVFLFLVTFSS